MPDAIFLKLKRANKHIEELERAIDIFGKSRPYEISGKRDIQTREELLYISKAPPIPDDIPIIAGDVIQNLYCGLDYFAWEIVKASGIKTPGTSTYFPISENVPSTKDDISSYNRKVDGMRDDAKKAIQAMEPYRGRNNHFWMLHKLNNLNKHRTLLTVGFAASGGISGPVDAMKVATFNYGPLEQGSILARFPPGTKDYDKIQFFFDVALNEPEADAAAMPLLVAMRSCHSLIFRTTQALSCYR